MIYKENVKAILECNFPIVKDEIIELVAERICDIHFQSPGDLISREAVKNFINEVRYSEKWLKYRADYGSNGQLDSIFTYVCNIPADNKGGNKND